MNKISQNTGEVLNSYLERFPEEENNFSILKKQIKNNEDLSTRKNFNWHLTASATVFDEKKQKVLLIRNKNLNKWLVPWWHYEECDKDILSSSKRELEEETWIMDYVIHNWHKINNLIPVSIDTHYIPENKKKWEDKHYHHDFNYLFLADSNQKLSLQEEEVDWLEWLDINQDFKDIHWFEKIKRILIN